MYCAGHTHIWQRYKEYIVYVSYFKLIKKQKQTVLLDIWKSDIFVCFFPGRVTSKTLKLLVTASPSNTQYLGGYWVLTGWFRFRIMSSSWLVVDSCSVSYSKIIWLVRTSKVCSISYSFFSLNAWNTAIGG